MDNPNRRDALVTVLGLGVAASLAGITKRPCVYCDIPVLRADVAAEFDNGRRSVIPADVIRAWLDVPGKAVHIRDGWDGPIVGEVVSWSFDGMWLIGRALLTPAGAAKAAQPGNAVRPRTRAMEQGHWPEFTTTDLVEIMDTAIVPNPCWSVE